MKTTRKLFAILLVLTGSVAGNAQIKFSEITNWLGEGKDSATMVVNFVNGEKDSCLAWGYLFNDSISGGELMDMVASNDPNFELDRSPYVNSIKYLGVMYLNNAKSNGVYWNTFNWRNSKWESNIGPGAMNYNGDQYGLSYTASDKNYDPITLPVLALPVANPVSFTFKNVEWWIGTGTDSSVLILDFQDGKGAMAWGYIHDGTKTGKDMLNAIDASETYMNVYADKFLDSIKFHGQEGINAKAGYYWGTWTSTNMTNWKSNSGVTTVLDNGDYFGVSFTNFNPAILPAVPSAVTNSTAVKDFVNSKINVYPNPVSEKLSFELDVNMKEFNISVMDIQGRVIFKARNQSSISVGEWNKGVYTLLVTSNNSTYSAKFVKN